MAINYERNKKYFKKTSVKPGLVMIVLGLLLFGLPGAGKLIAFLLVAAGAAWLYFQFSGLPTDGDVDNDALEVVRGLQQQALTKLGLDADEVTLLEPLIVSGPFFKTIGSGVQIRMGKDQQFRASNYEGVVIFFSEHQLHSYKFQFSLTQQNERREQTDEYFYRDVVSVSTQSQTEPIRDMKGQSRTVNYEEFRLTTSGGTSVTSAMRTQDASTGRTLQGARQLIREKKIV